MARLVRTEIYPGKVKHFRNNVERISTLLHGKWTSSGGESLVFRERRERELVAVTQHSPPYGKLTFSPTEHYRDSTPEDHSTWLVKKEGGEECAAIEVCQQPDGHSLVDFLDGYDPSWPEVSPIGSLFEEFCDWIVAQVWTGQPERKSDSRLPKKQKTRDKWKRVYTIYADLKREYRQLWDEGSIDGPEVKMEDLAERLNDACGWTLTPRHLRDIIKAGDAGLLT
jgi:hypothetical protein